MCYMNQPQPDRSLHEILEMVAKRMQVDFEESASIAHAASKGTIRERDVQRTFLEQYASGVGRITGSGEIVSVDGQVSGQCDLMIVDPETPPLWRKEDYAVVPVECCYIVVEVKSNLTTDELRTSWAAAKKIKGLPRSAYLPDPSPVKFTRTAHGRNWDHAFPIRYIVFGYDGALPGTLAKEMSVLGEGHADPAMGVDAVFVLNRGIVSWQDPSTGAFFERKPGSVAFASSATPANVLLFMVTAINNILSASRYNDRFNLAGYVQQPLGNVESWWRGGVQWRIVSLPGGESRLMPMEST